MSSSFSRVEAGASFTDQSPYLQDAGNVEQEIFARLDQECIQGTRKLVSLARASLISPETLLGMNQSQREVLSQLLRHGLPQLEGTKTSHEYSIAFNQAKKEGSISPKKVENLVHYIKKPELCVRYLTSWSNGGVGVRPGGTFNLVYKHLANEEPAIPSGSQPSEIDDVVDDSFVVVDDSFVNFAPESSELSGSPKARSLLETPDAFSDRSSEVPAGIANKESQSQGFCLVS